jgi:hypothetical protein
MITIGNGEKCPYCTMIVTAETDVSKHMIENHKEQFLKDLGF